MQKDRLKVQYLDETYKKLAVLGTDMEKETEKQSSVFLVQHKQTGKIYVKKYVDRRLLTVYEKLKGIADCHLEKIYDYAADEEKGIVILEYISGMTLQEYIEENGLFSEQDANQIIEELLQVIVKVHEAGIIHRDINPNNIMISNDGVVKLIDFDIARQKKPQKSKDTTILGTVGYAAPEQFGFLQTDERTDIYAVGVLWNVLLTGCFPAEKNYEISPVKEWIQRCTQIDGRLRFENAVELLKEIKKEKIKKAETLKKETTYVSTWIPGFRTGMIWKNVVATIGYLLMVLITIVSVEPCLGNWQACLLEIVAVAIYVWAAALLAANIGNWDRRWMFGNLPKPVMIVMRVFLWIILFYIGISLENYVRYDLMELPRK